MQRVNFEAIFTEVPVQRSILGSAVGLRLKKENLSLTEIKRIVEVLKLMDAVFSPGLNLWCIPVSALNGFKSVLWRLNQRVQRRLLLKSSHSKPRDRPLPLNRLFLQKKGGLCELCGNVARVCHHIHPLKYGGADTEDNLIALCSSCHRKILQYYEDRIVEELLRKDPSWFRESFKKSLRKLTIPTS